MKCLVCGNEFDGAGTDKCPRCAFPIIGMTEENEESRRWAAEQAEEYAQSLIDSCRISVSVFAYASYTDGTLHFREEREFPLAGGTDLRRGQIYWNPQEFAVNKQLNMEIIFRRKNGMHILERHLKMKVPPPAAPVPWRAGVLVQQDLNAAVVVGNSLQYSRSDLFDLLQ